MRTIIVVLTLALVAGYALAGFPLTDPTGSNQPARRPIEAARTRQAVVIADPHSDFAGDPSPVDRSSFLNAGNVTWSYGIPSPEGISRLAAVVAGGRLHIVTGEIAGGGRVEEQMIFDFADNTWSTGPAHPGGGISNANAVAVADSLIVVGGGWLASLNPYNRITTLNLNDNTWTAGAEIPQTNLLYYAMSAASGHAYIFGGANASETFNKVYRYDPAANSITTLADMPLALRSQVAAAVGDTIYLIGGQTVYGTPYIGTKNFLKYSISGNDWTVGPELPFAMSWGAGAAYNDPAHGWVIYVFGGYNASAAITGKVWSYTVATGTWEACNSLQTVRRSHGGAIYRDTLLAVCGWSGSFENTIERGAIESSVTYNDFLWLYADYGPPDTTLGARLMAMGDTLDYREVRFSTPTLEQLLPYRAVGVHSNYPFADPVALGNVLADYVDAGGGVVVAQFALSTGYELGGRLMSEDYIIINPGTVSYTPTVLGWYRAEHPIMAGVSAVQDLYPAIATFATSDSVARWEDGRPYIGVSRNQRVVGVNSYPGIHGYVERTGDWARVFRNALHYVTAVQDVGIKAIIAPTGTVDSGAVVVPMARVQNYGNSSVSFPVVMRIGPAGGMLNAVVYADTQQISDLAPGDSVDLSFVAWTAIECGVMVVKCSTMLDGDISPGNDAVTDSVLVEPIVGVKDEVSDLMPLEFGLDQPVPNPFSGQVRVSYALPGTATVSLRVYCPAGKLVRTLRSGMQQPGYYRVAWDGRDNNGKSVGKGIYYYRFDAGDYTATRKVVKSE